MYGALSSGVRNSRAERTVWVAPIYGTECCGTNVKVWVGGV